LVPVRQVPRLAAYDAAVSSSLAVRLATQGPGRSRPRRADHPRPHPDQHDAGDLHRHRRASAPRCADPATKPARRDTGL